MSKEEQALLEADWGRECVEHAEEVGIDLGLLTENLRLTPRERMQQHDTSVRQILAVRKRLGIEENDDA